MSHHIILFLNCVRLWSFSHRLETKVRERKKAIMIKEKRETLSSDLNVTFIFLCATKGVHRTGRWAVSQRQHLWELCSLSHPTSSYVSLSRDKRSICANSVLLMNTRYSLSVLAYWVESFSVLRTPARRYMGVAVCWSAMSLKQPKSGTVGTGGLEAFFFFFPSEPEIVYVCAHTCS